MEVAGDNGTGGRRRRAPRKSDAERGALGAWSYNARDTLNLSPEEIAKEIGISPVYVRKIDGGSERDPSRSTIALMDALFQRLGAERGIAIPHPPHPYNLPESGSPAARDGKAGLSDLIGALADQATAMARILGAAARTEDATEVRLRAMEAEVKSLRERLGVEASRGQSTHRATGE